MAIGHPLSIENLPAGVAGKNLHNKLPRRLWNELRAKAQELYGNSCGICHMTEVKLHLHESWDFWWVEENVFDPQGWVRYASEKGWVRYEGEAHDHIIDGRRIILQAITREESKRVQAVIDSNLPPYVDRMGALRFAEEECGQPHQTLIGLISLCPLCHAVKHLEKVRHLAEKGKLDIEPILEHFMRVNGVTRQKALRQWAYARGQQDWLWPDRWCYDSSERSGGVIQWTQWIQEYDAKGNPLSETPLDEWIARIKTESIETISPHLFLRV